MSAKASGAVQNADEQFPDEMWENMLSKPSESRDLNALSQVCATFQRILRPKRTINLFPEVLHLIYKLLDKPAILNCRLVGRSWKCAVDRLAESNEVVLMRAYVFYDIQGLTKFMTLMKNHSNFENPFISRDVEFHDFELEPEEDEDVKREYWTTVVELCQKFGTHIRKCRLNVGILGSEEFPIVYIYKVVTSSMQLMPGLRSLTFTTNEMHWNADYGEEEMEKLAQTIEGCVNPKLPFLEHLGLPVLPGVWMEQMLESGKTTLIHLVEEEVAFGDYKQEFRGIGNLTRLKVVEVPYLSKVELVTSLLQSNLQNQLTTLYATLDCENHLELSGLIHDLNFFRNLVKLDLGLHFLGADGKLYENGNKSKPSLTLDKLNYLEISVDRVGHRKRVPKTGFDFLGYLPSLEEFALEVSYYGIKDTRNDRERIQISGYAHRMKESNIWELFPKLNKLRLRSDGLTKGEWNYFRNEMN